MSPPHSALGCIVLCCLWTRPLLAAGSGFDWQADRPEKHGFSAAKLDAAKEALARRGTKELLIIRNDRIILEWYAPGFDAKKTHFTASLAKALVGGMSLAAALEDGRLRLDDSASKFIPQWQKDPRKSKITILHLATHSSGLQDANEDGVSHDKLPGWMGDFWKRKPDPFTISRDQAPVIFEPGEKWHYSNPGMAMLSYAVTASLKNQKEQDLKTLLAQRVYAPIGIGDKEWSVGYGTTYDVDGLKLTANWGGAAFTARAVARIARLMLRKGDWEGRRILSREIVEKCTASARTPIADRAEKPFSPAATPGWYCNSDGVWPNVPRDAFAGAGAQHQLLLVIPSRNMIIVRFGGTLATDKNDRAFWQAAYQQCFEPLTNALADSPCPPSPVIRGVSFDPPQSIIRLARDSDNWPITWADDDRLYTSFGDGTGFAPKLNEKLSLGLAQIEGNPPDIRGINLHSPSAQRKGDGKKGPKASGMLCVNGTLYMWVRNTNNATLAWSADRGRTWEWGFTFDTSFGCPAFLNFGQDYRGARDDFVYTYSQDGASAYEPCDGIVLARVHKDRIRQKDSYEFFEKTGPDGQPMWTSDIQRRGHVFSFPGHCERLDVSYNPGLKRCLMALSFGHGNGWGLFDAPEPWGPWTTAFITRQSDCGDIHGLRLPAKWISQDGKTIWLAFSGRSSKEFDNDALCLRKMVLKLDGANGTQ